MSEKPDFPFTLVDQPAEKSELLDLDSLVLPDPNDDGAWQRLAQQVLPLYMRIAAGQVEGSAHQVRILERIMDRGFGKVGNEPRRLETPGVIILPTLGPPKSMKVCPNCLAELGYEEETVGQDNVETDPNASAITDPESEGDG